MATATRSRNQSAASASEEARPPSRLMRVPLETYELVAKWAEKHRRAMNQQMAVIVEDWDKAENARIAREEAKEAKAKSA